MMDTEILKEISENHPLSIADIFKVIIQMHSLQRIGQPRDQIVLPLRHRIPPFPGSLPENEGGNTINQRAPAHIHTRGRFYRGFDAYLNSRSFALSV